MESLRRNKGLLTVCLILVAFAAAQYIAIDGLQEENEDLRQQLLTANERLRDELKLAREANSKVFYERHYNLMQEVKLQSVAVRETVKEACRP